MFNLVSHISFKSDDSSKVFFSWYVYRNQKSCCPYCGSAPQSGEEKLLWEEPFRIITKEKGLKQLFLIFIYSM